MSTMQKLVLTHVCYNSCSYITQNILNNVSEPYILITKQVLYLVSLDLHM